MTSPKEYSAQIHELKTWPEPFDAVIKGDKPFEWRKNDRNFQRGDILLLKEYDLNNLASPGKYTGRFLAVVVTYIIKGPAFEIPEEYCIMGIRRIGSKECVIYGKKLDQLCGWMHQDPRSIFEGAKSP